MPHGNPAKWYHYITQLLYEIAITYSVLVTVLYFVFESDKFDGSDHLNVHSHIMNGKITTV